ncbi:hypothetical protein, partial [Ralstonia pseudosolanacearum]
PPGSKLVFKCLQSPRSAARFSIVVLTKSTVMTMARKIRGVLLYVAALTSVLYIHAYALHIDEKEQTDLRVRTVHQQA